MKKILLLLSLVFLTESAFAQWKCPPRPSTRKATTTKKKAAPVRKAVPKSVREERLWQNDVVRKAKEFGLVTQFTVIDGQPTWIIGQPINPRVAQHDLERDTRLLDYAEQKYKVFVHINEDFIQKCNGVTYWFFTYVYNRF